MRSRESEFTVSVLAESEEPSLTRFGCARRNHVLPALDGGVLSRIYATCLDETQTSAHAVKDRQTKPQPQFHSVLT